MDKYIHTVLNSINNLYENRFIQAQNLANISVPGYRRDISVQPTDSVFLDLDGSMDSRAFAVREDRNKFDGTPGAIDRTDNDMDIAIRGAGYMYGTVGDDPFLTRRGDLSVSPEGILTNGAGQQILDTELNPIQVPPNRKIKITEDGRVLITPLGAQDDVEQLAGTIGLTTAENQLLKKSVDGQIRTVDGGVPPVDQQPSIMQGFVELSNVSAVEELVSSIENQRHYEINIKMITTARDMDESSTSLLTLPS